MLKNIPVSSLRTIVTVDSPSMDALDGSYQASKVSLQCFELVLYKNVLKTK